MIWALITTRLGKLGAYLATAAGIAFAALMVFLRIKAAGRDEERAAEAARTAAAVKTAKETADEVHQMDRADVDRGLAEWMRDRPER